MVPAQPSYKSGRMPNKVRDEKNPSKNGSASNTQQAAQHAETTFLTLYALCTLESWANNHVYRTQFI